MKALKTQNNNFIVFDEKSNKVGYFNASGAFLKGSSLEEWEWAKESWGVQENEMNYFIFPETLPGLNINEILIPAIIDGFEGYRWKAGSINNGLIYPSAYNNPLKHLETRAKHFEYVPVMQFSPLSSKITIIEEGENYCIAVYQNPDDFDELYSNQFLTAFKTVINNEIYSVFTYVHVDVSTDDGEFEYLEEMFSILKGDFINLNEPESLSGKFKKDFGEKFIASNIQ